MGNIQASTYYSCSIVETELHGTWYKLNDRISWPTLKIPNDNQVYFVINQVDHMFNGFWKYTCMSNPDAGLYALKQDPLDILDLGSFVEDIRAIINMRIFHMLQHNGGIPYVWSIKESTTELTLDTSKPHHTVSYPLSLSTIPCHLNSPFQINDNEIVLVSGQLHESYNGQYTCVNNILVPILPTGKEEQERLYKQRMILYILKYLGDHRNETTGLLDTLKANPSIYKYITKM